MKVIYKYPLEIKTNQTVSLPGYTGYSDLLRFDFQHGLLCLWALVDTTEPSVPIDISIFGTGHDLTDADMGKKTHLGTVFDPRGFVWHIFADFSSICLSGRH